MQLKSSLKTLLDYTFSVSEMFKLFIDKWYLAATIVLISTAACVSYTYLVQPVFLLKGGYYSSALFIEADLQQQYFSRTKLASESRVAKRIQMEPEMIFKFDSTTHGHIPIITFELSGRSSDNLRDKAERTLNQALVEMNGFMQANFSAEVGLLSRDTFIKDEQNKGFYLGRLMQAEKRLEEVQNLGSIGNFLISAPVKLHPRPLRMSLFGVFLGIVISFVLLLIMATKPKR